MVRIYSCEGNIGAGKTTLLGHIENLAKLFNQYQIIVLREPVDVWSTVRSPDGLNILENFYKDPVKYAFPFQVLAFTTRLSMLKNAIKNNPDCEVIICERSLYADGNIFAKMLYDSGKIEDVNYQIYLNWFDTFSGEFPVHKVIYVKAAPEKCYARIAKRSREGEENIPLEYLTACSLYHDNMLDKTTDNCVCDEQLILDGNIDIYENKTQLDEWIQEIEQYIL
jgi:deoxyadenosine/deoxycytidine kinase